MKTTAAGSLDSVAVVESTLAERARQPDARNAACAAANRASGTRNGEHDT